MQPVLGGFDASRYTTERLWATAADGTQVPISLVYRTDLAKKDGTDPLLLDGYGRVQGFAAACSPWTASAGRRLVAAIPATHARVQPAPAVHCRYGAYEICNDPDFRSSRLSLIDRGFTFAIAHVRGGGARGAWPGRGGIGMGLRILANAPPLPRSPTSPVTPPPPKPPSCKPTNR